MMLLLLGLVIILYIYLSIHLSIHGLFSLLSFVPEVLRSGQICPESSYWKCFSTQSQECLLCLLWLILSDLCVECVCVCMSKVIAEVADHDPAVQLLCYKTHLACNPVIKSAKCIL